ncbi:hypothetical protein MPH47_17285 [Psychrobacillus psychrodurans]|uniref:hypothetical protein n=1 Tax=Psychrobacillus psychrodurans TaxID=126157 RepID=UPI001F4E6B84|nr:hypothetical protein [Psychrobacillus psychrodurans]MCK1998952.1 hypothetical protein [Psychrobacillus psychrodurans]
MNKLSANTKLLLLTVHGKHIKTMSPEEKEKHSLENIVKVVVDHKNKYLKVYYKHEWYHYTNKGSWY